MKNHITLKIILTFFLSSLIFSCSKKNNNIDFDFTTLKKPKKNKVLDKENKNENKIILDNKIYIKDLVPLKNKEEVLSKTKFGKKDPFSKGESQSNKLNSNLKLTGFLNTEINKYVFVSYLDNEGTIKEGSIGGVNTDLLPNGAKVIKIDPKNMKLIIYFENENFIFEM
jgi:hypothetical protein